MKVWQQLSFWTNDVLIGDVAVEILEIAKRHGEPKPPAGMAMEKPIPFTFPVMSDEEPQIEQFLRRVAIVYQAVDLHIYWHKRKMVCTKVFDPIPEWAQGMDNMVPDPNWLKFESEAMEVIDRFVGTLANRGIYRTQ